jgi:hypothetical protein
LRRELTFCQISAMSARGRKQKGGFAACDRGNQIR